MRRGPRRDERGVTYVELLATAGLLAILALAVLPTLKAGQRRAQEIEYRRALREIHTCLDEFKLRRMAAMGQLNPPPGDGVTIAEGELYPEELEDLVEGVPVVGPNPDKRWRCLREIPIDPFTKKREWNLCCDNRTQSDNSCSTATGGIWKVTTKADVRSVDGETRLKDCNFD